ncbi:hypothetical protein [Robertkochia aurantiaca]|nr:hypothetical protein [Robertkochia sp. 3YJGBD-33]
MEKRNKDQVILADMHDNGVYFNRQLLLKKQQKETPLEINKKENKA